MIQGTASTGGQETGQVAEIRKAAARATEPRGGIFAALALLDLRPGMRVLDAGRGPGVHPGFFAERVAPEGLVDGIDADVVGRNGGDGVIG